MHVERIAGFAPELIALAIEARGYAEVDGFLSAPLLLALRAENEGLLVAGALRPARIGGGERERLVPDVRGDLIHWIDPAAVTESQRAYLELTNVLRLALNRQLFLGLFDFEACHSNFPPGARYHRHIDRLRGSDLRVITLVCYLNDGWTRADGGALRLQLETGAVHDVLPEGGVAVLFLSDRFPHEVLPARRDRLGISGWYRQRG